MSSVALDMGGTYTDICILGETYAGAGVSATTLPAPGGVRRADFLPGYATPPIEREESS